MYIPPTSSKHKIFRWIYIKNDIQKNVREIQIKKERRNETRQRETREGDQRERVRKER